MPEDEEAGGVAPPTADTSMTSSRGWPQVDDRGAGGEGAAGGNVALLDEEDPDPSPLYVACEQHPSGLLTRFLADSVRTLMPPHRSLWHITLCCA